MLTIFQNNDRPSFKKRRLGPGPTSPKETSTADSHSDSGPENDDFEWENVDMGFNRQSIDDIKIADYESDYVFFGQEQLREVPLFTQTTIAEWYDSMITAYMSEPIDHKVAEQSSFVQKADQKINHFKDKTITIEKREHSIKRRSEKVNASQNQSGGLSRYGIKKDLSKEESLINSEINKAVFIDVPSPTILNNPDPVCLY